MQRCGVEGEGRVCTLPAGRHAYHMADGVSWVNEIEASRPEARAQGRTLASLARGATPARTARMDTRHLGAIQADWQAEQGAWIEGAYRALAGLVADRAEPFTTPEHLWPLLDTPPGGGQMRAMSVVVQRALRAGLVVEVGAKRLRDTYRTRDGHEFPMNKLVPVYQRAAALSS